MTATIEEIIKDRGITRILHFTTTTGLLGIIATGSVKSRKRLPKENYLEYIYKPNCEIRYDPEWLDYVNLSIQEINSTFFKICANRWHTDREWCVLSFAPEIITHNQVYFATTNNRYTGVRHAPGSSGLLALYAKTITQWPGKVIRRSTNHPQNLPTCSQAEVLYPGELSLDFLNKVYLSTDEQGDNFQGQVAVFERANIHYEVDTSIFQ